MAATQNLSSFSCELRILRTKDIEFASSKNLFVRYYLSAGNNQKIRLNTREISSNSDFIWNESFKLDCYGSEETMEILKQQSVIFELRQRKAMKIQGSKLLGRAEVPWKQVFESPNLVIDKWVPMVSKSRVFEGMKVPKLQIGISVKVAAKMKKNSTRRRRRRNDDNECVCRNEVEHCCKDYEIFAIAAALEGL